MNYISIGTRFNISRKVEPDVKLTSKQVRLIGNCISVFVNGVLGVCNIGKGGVVLSSGRINVL